MLSVLLAFLKFVALGIGTVSGLVGTITETKEKSTGKLTHGGRLIIVLIVASGVVAGITQSIELYLKRLSDQADSTQRLQEFEALYSLTHPLGGLETQINVTYPITDGIGGLNAAWLGRVQRSTSKTFAVLNEADDPLRPQPNNGEAREFGLFIKPEFDVEINRAPTQVGGDGAHLRDHGVNLMFRTSTSRTNVYVHFDDKKIDNQVYSPTARLIDDGSISSWRDLYGAELIIKLPQTAPTGARVTHCVLTFTNGAKFGSRIIEVPLTDTDRRANPFNEPFSNIAYVHVLTEAELGSKPSLLH